MWGAGPLGSSQHLDETRGTLALPVAALLKHSGSDRLLERVREGQQLTLGGTASGHHCLCHRRLAWPPVLPLHTQFGPSELKGWGQTLDSPSQGPLSFCPLSRHHIQGWLPCSGTRGATSSFHCVWEAVVGLCLTDPKEQFPLCS